MHIDSLEDVNINSVNNSFKENIFKTAIVFSVVAIIFLIWGDIFLSLIIGFVIGSILIGWDSRVVIAFGLIFLIFCPFLLVFEKKALAEEMAVKAYCMLALGVILLMIQYVKNLIISKTRSQKEPISETSRNLNTRRPILLVSGIGLILLIIISGVFSFFYFKLEGKLSENDKLIKSLIEGQSTDNAQVAGISTTGLDEVVTDNVDPKNYKISIINTTEQEGLENKFSESFKKQGFLNVLTSKSDQPLEQRTLIQYCSNCFDVMQELTLSLYSQIDLLTIENPKLLNEITISLGTDQMHIDNNEISISILNGSKVSGAAKTLQTKMLEKGFNVVSNGNADKKTYQNTIIKYVVGDLEKASIVKDYLSELNQNAELQEATALKTDIEIIIGKQ